MSGGVVFAMRRVGMLARQRARVHCFFIKIT